jgi:hypothetical protein
MTRSPGAKQNMISDAPPRPRATARRGLQP